MFNKSSALYKPMRPLSCLIP